MKIAVAAEVCSFNVMSLLKDHLIRQGHEVIDLGMQSADEPHYFTETPVRVAAAILKGEADRGILMCGTGNGVCITANKFKGIYAGLAESTLTAHLHRVINRCNVLCMGAWVVGIRAIEISDAFLAAEVGEGMTKERIRVQEEGYLQIKQYEEENFR